MQIKDELDSKYKYKLVIIENDIDTEYEFYYNLYFQSKKALQEHLDSMLNCSNYYINLRKREK